MTKQILTTEKSKGKSEKKTSGNSFRIAFEENMESSGWKIRLTPRKNQEN